MTKLSDAFKNKVLNHAEELVSRHKILMKTIKRDRKKGLPIRPTDRHVGKYWPMEMLLAEYGAIILRDEFLPAVFHALGIGKSKRLKAITHAMCCLRCISNRQRKEKMQQEWQKQL